MISLVADDVLSRKVERHVIQCETEITNRESKVDFKVDPQWQGRG